MIERMFDSDTNTGSEMTAAEWDAEERLIFELMDAGLEPVPADEPMVLPTDIGSWPADVQLAVLLSAVDVDRLSGSDRVAYLKARERLNAAGAASTLAAIRSISDAYDEFSEDIEDPEAGASMEIRAALRWTRRATDHEMGLAHDLHVRLPGLFERLSQGLIDRARTRRLVDHTSHLSVGHARQVVDSLLDDAPRWTTGQLTERVRRACLEIDPDTARDRYEESRKERRVVPSPIGIPVSGWVTVQSQTPSPNWAVS